MNELDDGDDEHDDGEAAVDVSGLVGEAVVDAYELVCLNNHHHRRLIEQYQHYRQLSEVDWL